MDKDLSVKNRQTMTPYKQAIARYIRSVMMLKGLKYNDLAERLAEKSIVMTAENLRSKVSKGIFSADLFVAIIQVLEVEERALIEILAQLEDD